MDTLQFTGGTIVLENRLVPNGQVDVENGRIQAVRETPSSGQRSGKRIELHGGFLVPGFIDLHVHGGAGADFMDGTEEAFRTAIHAHTRHGTTSLLPTTTVARHEQ